MPPLEEIQKIEGPVIVEEAAGGGIVGARVGVICAIGETLKGDPNVPVEITNPSDFLSLVGGFNKFVGDGAASSYDGNLFVFLAALKVSRLILVPVDDRVGAVDLARVSPGSATMQSTNQGPYALADADTIAVTIEGPVVDGTATVQAEAAVSEGSIAENYDLTAAGDRSLTLQVNGGPLQTKTIGPGDVVAIGAVTADELAIWANIQFAAVSVAATTGATKVTVTTDRKGLSASLLFGGGMRSKIGWPDCRTNPWLVC